MSETSKRERFGRYLILDHLLDGGMAKICRARFLGEQADKVVAIKMVQPQFSKDEAFKAMFMDEIKVTFGLIHPNVIQTYDYGIHKGQLFVAMEYCDGRNLKEYLDKLKERKFVFPVEISTYIISQASQGLYYAHTFRDKLTGQEANIIHRDISPHNIMLTYDGSVKIIDFGIAKSQKNTESTQAGTIKGKLSYLAPEYLEGEELDARYDQFAVGITLWEMLCSRKLFKENNDLAVLKKIQECKIPVPSSINPNVPKELDEIVLKALSKDRNKRYENLDQMNRALMKFLYAKYPDFNATDLSYFSQELFREEIKKDREKMFEFGKIDIRPYLDELKKELESGIPSTSETSESALKETKGREKEQVLDFGFEESGLRAKSRTSTLKKTGISKDKLTGTSADSTIPMPEKSNSAVDVDLVSKTPATHKTGSTKFGIKKGEETRTPKPSKKKGSAGVIAALLVVAIGCAGYLYFSHNEANQIVDNVLPLKHVKERRPAAKIQKTEDPTPEDSADKGQVALAHFDKQKMQVFVNNHKKEVDPLSIIKVPVGEDFTLRVQIEGKKHFIKVIRVENTSTVEVEIPEMPVIAYGYINTSSSCAQGEIRFEILGEKRVGPIPMPESFGIAFPLGIDAKGELAPATYEIYFKKKGEDIERKIEVTLDREDQTFDLCEVL